MQRMDAAVPHHSGLEGADAADDGHSWSDPRKGVLRDGVTLGEGWPSQMRGWRADTRCPGGRWGGSGLSLYAM